MNWNAPSEKDTAPARIGSRLAGKSVWLSQARMAGLFDRSKKTVSEHLQNLFEEAELDPDAVARNFRTTAAHGKFNLTSGRIKTMRVPVPAIDEQEDVPRALPSIDTKSLSARAKQSALQDLFRTLLDELMTAMTRVQEIEFSTQHQGAA